MEYGLFIFVFVAAILLLYFLLDVHYFLRLCLNLLLARFFKTRCHILDTTTISGICLTNDVDAFLSHMNNARYLRELDFARADFFERTNLYRTIVSKGGSIYQGAVTSRYRRFIRNFQRFKIVTKIIYWDDQSVYMEHRFVNPADQFIHCIVIGRQRIVNCSAEEVMNDLLSPKKSQMKTSLSTDGSVNAGYVTTTADPNAMENGQIRAKMKPEILPELQKWIEYNELSSQRLRPS